MRVIDGALVENIFYEHFLRKALNYDVNFTACRTCTDCSKTTTVVDLEICVLEIKNAHL